MLQQREREAPVAAAIAVVVVAVAAAAAAKDLKSLGDKMTTNVGKNVVFFAVGNFSKARKGWQTHSSSVVFLPGITQLLNASSVVK